MACNFVVDWIARANYLREQAGVARPSAGDGHVSVNSDRLKTIGPDS